MEYISNPGLYEEMSKPYENASSATKAMQAFADDLRELRKKHRIPNVVAILGTKTKDGDNVRDQVSWTNCGDLALVPDMLNAAFSFVVESLREKGIVIISEGENNERQAKD